MKYGDLPKHLGMFNVDGTEMMFYQYLPIKLPGTIEPIYEQRLSCFNSLIGVICCDFIGQFGLDRYKEFYLYLTAKRLFQAPGCSFNRTGYHSDGFMTSDINYIWSDKNPTVFNKTEFNLTQDDFVSMGEMAEQALISNEVTYPEGSLLRLNQFNIHKVAQVTNSHLRTFLKVSFSEDKYDLSGNSRNYMIDYSWTMRARQLERNIPQKI